MMTFLVESLNLETVVHTKSNLLMCLRLRRILLKHQFRIPSPLQPQQESTRKTGFPTITIEAGRFLPHFRRISAHALARQLVYPLLLTRRCHLKKRRVYFSTSALTDGNHGQAIIGMHPLVGLWIIGRSDVAQPLLDGRLGRDTSLHNNVQLLQKHGRDRSRELRRDSSSQGTEDQRWERGRRASNATTTHSVISGRDSSRESLRQLPPHLASIPKPLPPSHTHQLPHLFPPSGRHSSAREPWRPGRSPEQSPVIPSPSDTSSHVAPSSISSVVAPSPQTTTPTDLETARRAAMHSAAERAKIRRQQDEEERERERERARKRAAELEMKLAEDAWTQEPPAAQVGFC